MPSNRRVDPRIRALGKARIDVTRRAKDERDWQRQWREPRYPFPFSWSQEWKQSVQYIVDDYAAEVGFWIDVVGLSVCAFSPSFAMLTSPAQDFTFSVVAALEGQLSTPPDALRVQFMITDILGIADELERRGVVFEQKPQPERVPVSSVYSGCFRTPHGICVDLIGIVEAEGDHQQRTEQDPIDSGVEDDPFFFDTPAEGQGLPEAESDSGKIDPQADERPEEEAAEWPASSPWLDVQPPSGTPASTGLDDIEEAGRFKDDAPFTTDEDSRQGEEETLNFGELGPDTGPKPRDSSREREDLPRRPESGRSNEIFSRMNPVVQPGDHRRNSAARRPNSPRRSTPWPGKDLPARPNGSQHGSQRPPAAPPRPNGSAHTSPDRGSKTSPQPNPSRRPKEEQHEFPFPLPDEEEEELKYENLDDLEGMDDSDDLYP